MSAFPFMPVFAPTGKKTLIQALSSLGLTANLQLALDAGDLDSVDNPATQFWRDTSGNALDFWNGTSSGADARDMTFFGDPGSKTENEYWESAEWGLFRLATANPVWVNALHKAGAEFTLGAWVHYTGVRLYLFGTVRNSASLPGLRFRVNSGGVLALQIGAAWSLMLNHTVPDLPVSEGINYIAVSMSNSEGRLTYAVNGDMLQYDYSYGNPTGNNATNTAEILGSGGSEAAAPAGSRAHQFFAYDRALSASELRKIYNATRSRYGV